MNTCTMTIDVALDEIEVGPSIEDVVADGELIPELEELEARFVAQFLSMNAMTTPRRSEKVVIGSISHSNHVVAGFRPR
jgi:hypothetical protein